MDDDGSPETLRLCFATPKRWLENGKVIKVTRAPTCFGPISFTVTSELNKGRIIANVELPTRNPSKKTLLRIRVPDGWGIASAKCGSQTFRVDADGTMDITHLKGKAIIRFAVHSNR